MFRLGKITIASDTRITIAGFFNPIMLLIRKLEKVRLMTLFLRCVWICWITCKFDEAGFFLNKECYWISIMLMKIKHFTASHFPIGSSKGLLDDDENFTTNLSKLDRWQFMEIWYIVSSAYDFEIQWYFGQSLAHFGSQLKP